uniref:peptidylprolyl isomerase n=1 Tax=uncultured marine thaumarchaeote KM3_156_A10 TaxID=1456021 RepID=A0A075GKW9_9ARCH|nr:peptidyl-prolyl isomerase [uncultured marine thaumarchaeote KM3_156_A10]
MQFEFHFQVKKHKTSLKFSIPILILISLISISAFGNTVFAENDDKIVIMYTNSGHLIIELFPDDAPNTVENFLNLTESGFYDNLVFHRIIKDFMIQGGDPLTKFEGGFTNIPQWGTGGADYDILAEFNSIKHNRGIVSMARGADIDSASSQFFIVHKDSNHLDGKYTVFGKLLTEESYDTLDKIANLQTTSKNIPNDLSASQIIKAAVITRADIENPPSIEELDRLDVTYSSPTMISDRYVNTEYDFSIIPPKGWTVLYPEPGSKPNDPIITFLGQKEQLLQGIDEFAPYIYINANELGDKTFQENLDSRITQYHNMEQTKALLIESEKMHNLITETGRSYGAYFLEAKQLGMGLPVPFAQIILSHSNFIYGITYSHHEELFQNNMAVFDSVIKSFDIASETTEPDIRGLLEEAEIKTTEPETTGGGCLIATAAFGSELASQVQQLRELRDNTVLQTESGTSFMAGFNQFYYSFSPIIADYERENPAFKEVVKLTLTPLLTLLSLLQHVDIDSESEMLVYGIGIILLNIGMYFVAPAVLIMKVRSLTSYNKIPKTI